MMCFGTYMSRNITLHSLFYWKLFIRIMNYEELSFIPQSVQTLKDTLYHTCQIFLITYSHFLKK